MPVFQTELKIVKLSAQKTEINLRTEKWLTFSQYIRKLILEIKLRFEASQVVYLH